MELRNHLVMICDGVMHWPPKWLQVYGKGRVSVSGEVGVSAKAVFNFLQGCVNKRIRDIAALDLPKTFDE